MSNLKSIKTVSFPNGYTVKLPYEVTIDCTGNKEAMLFEILIKQIIKLKEEIHEQPKTKHRR